MHKITRNRKLEVAPGGYNTMLEIPERVMYRSIRNFNIPSGHSRVLSACTEKTNSHWRQMQFSQISRETASIL
jgi:hypothetical protein